jgi:signal transduction histidine kinase/ligand-binding sensor domain-containing protein
MERRAARTQAKVYATLILLACCPCVSALNPSLDINQYAHTAWTTRDGFFKGAIYAIAQTPDGYLWLGTEFGLLRFDGVRTVPWQPPAGDHLPDSNIRTLLAARDGRLWIGTNHGLASWRDGKLAHHPELAKQSIATLLEDRQGTVWVGGLAVPTGRLCAIQSGRVQCQGDDGRFGFGVLSLYGDSRGNLWAGATTGLLRWKPGPPRLYPTPGPVAEFRALIDGDNDALLMSMPGGIRRLVDGKVEAYPLPGIGLQFSPTKLLRDRDGGLWIGTNSQGIVHVHQGRADHFTPSDGLSGDSIHGIFEDREGNIWAATGDGLDRFRDFAVPTISVKQGLSSADAWSVLAAKDGSVWLGTRDGLTRWNNEQITIYRDRSSGLPNDADSLFQDDRGRIWVSTARRFAYFENGQLAPVGGLPGGVVHSIAGDTAGNLWIADQDHGLFHLVEGSAIERIPWAQLGRKDFAYALSPDPAQGGLWLGFYQGGLEHFKDGKVRASYSSAEGLGEGMVTGLQFDSEGTLWAATEGGLSRVKNGRVATLTTENGLPCDTVHWAMEDNDHSFWLDMACSLVRIARPELVAWASDPKRTIQVTVFDSSDGARTHAAVYSGFGPRAAKTTDGKIWFVAGDGVSVIDPRHLPLNKLPPPVHIEQITADRKTYDASSNLRLPPLVRDLEIDYTALSLVTPEKNRFRVKLEGWDRDWKDVGNERKAFYGNLPPRSYRFRVMASNNSGVWNEAGASFDFSIAPAYYQTTWFRASIVAAILALLWGLYRYRLHQIAREFNVRLEERVGERTRIARDLHDTLLQSFQGLMLHLQVVDDLLPQGKAKVELEKTLDRADQAIAEGRTAVYALRSSTTTTNDLAQAVREVGNELAAPGAATFRLVVEGPVRDLHPIIRDEVYRIARESLRNAFGHARARHIEAELIYADRLFRLRIRDDGQGIAPAILEEGRPGHYGLPGMRERAQQIGAKLTIWSGGGSGTEIELRLEGSIAYGTPPGRSRLRLFGKKAG